MKEKFYLLIAGGRDFVDYRLLKEKCDFILKNQSNKEIVIVNGLAKGADTLGKLYALDNGFETVDFKPDWSLGKIAGIKRNQEMANFLKTQKNYGCICFWDTKSRGTKSMINICIKEKIPYRVYNYTSSAESKNTSIGISKNGNMYVVFQNKNLTSMQQYLRKVLEKNNIYYLIQ